MSGLDNFMNNAKTTLKEKINAAPKDLKTQYIAIAKPLKPSEAEFVISEARFNASHITKGFTSKDEFKDDLKALILKPALLTFEAAYHGFRFTLKLMEMFAHLVVALIDFLFQPPKDPKTGVAAVLGRINLFDNAPKAVNLPEADLKNAGNAAIDATESLVKLVVYPLIASAELYVQGFSFVAKCLFSLDDSLGEKLNAAAESGKGYIQDLMAPK